LAAAAVISGHQIQEGSLRFRGFAYFPRKQPGDFAGFCIEYIGMVPSTFGLLDIEYIGVVWVHFNKLGPDALRGICIGCKYAM
jgi:hypothetical protein